jgi:hypothetical protein
MLITGLRGVGKTVLLNTFEAIAEEQGLRTAKSEITHETEFRPLIARLARRALLAISPAKRMKERARRAAAVFKAFTLRTPEGLEIGVDVEAMLGRADSGDLGDDLSDLFVALGEAAAEHETGIVFLLDEVQFLDRAELEALIAALHQVSQRELPLTLAGAGLPQLPALTGAAKSYAERLFRFPTIDRLSDQAARDALELPAQAEGVGFEREATNRILELTEGYPYFLQEYGKHAWNVAAGPTITVGDVERAHDVVQLELDESFFRVRIGPRHQSGTRLPRRDGTSRLRPLPLRRDRRQARTSRPRKRRPHARAPDRKGPDLQPFLRPQRVHRAPVRRLHPAKLPARGRELKGRISLNKLAFARYSPGSRLRPHSDRSMAGTVPISRSRSNRRIRMKIRPASEALVSIEIPPSEYVAANPP